MLFLNTLIQVDRNECTAYCDSAESYGRLHPPRTELCSNACSKCRGIKFTVSPISHTCLYYGSIAYVVDKSFAFYSVWSLSSCTISYDTLCTFRSLVLHKHLDQHQKSSTHRNRTRILHNTDRTLLPTTDGYAHVPKPKRHAIDNNV